mmetsp:Transcript_29071/g.81350  ORF Transcript_29071/g.81350 Transcript_29071/m.81350 type:complete len:261 (+) Transcript_29071:255-1037(+)|eukprot:CAMPEP_0119138242 /NCGR_PEP_ID=MMETSP1310-20130426/25296_1 /TAXON_ID=464262 /ORGANISM="Genus nov. species nov., Strain RCC2339" /LENGTH=260 /DNA_ID=CAMNT_0007129417 /DNA_START=193 /DNA_END=975 /DNA_ORIENTATION=+
MAAETVPKSAPLLGYSEDVFRSEGWEEGERAKLRMKRLADKLAFGVMESMCPRRLEYNVGSHTADMETYGVAMRDYTTMDVLPDDVLLLIFRMLGVSDLARVARVSIRWRAVSYDNFVWRPHLERLRVRKQMVFDFLSRGATGKALRYAEDLESGTNRDIHRYLLAASISKQTRAAFVLLYIVDLVRPRGAPCPTCHQDVGIIYSYSCGLVSDAALEFASMQNRQGALEMASPLYRCPICRTSWNTDRFAEPTIHTSAGQ